VGRATAATLAQLDPWLEEVRALPIDGLVEKSAGIFYRRSKPLLHFHEDASGVSADVKIAGEWVRVPIDRVAGRRRVIGLLRNEHCS
jgi:hypothetical protein